MSKLSLVPLPLLALALASQAALAQTRRPEGATLPAAPVVGFGTATALAEGHLLVGRSSVTVGFPVPPTSAGAVFDFPMTDGGFGPPVQLQPAEPMVGDAFGSALAVAGPRVLVGAPGHAGGTGTAYIFGRRGDAWVQNHRFEAPGVVPGDRFGASVALEGDWALIGAPGAERGRGAAHLFRSSEGRWTHIATIPAVGPDTTASFGRAVAMGGGYAFVGAPGPTVMAGMGQVGRGLPGGSVHLFTLGGNAPAYDTTITSADTTVRALGTALHADGEGVWAGAPASLGARGAVLRLERRGGIWREVGRLVPAEGPVRLAGYSVAPAGADVVVGAPFTKGTAGAALVFSRTGETWTETARLEPPVEGIAALSGMAVAAGPETIVVGSPMSAFFEGVGHVYRRSPDGWTALAPVVDMDPGLPAITGGERRCDSGDIDGFACDHVDLLAFIPTKALGAPRGIMLNDIWGWTDPQTGREIAIVGRMDATMFVDVTNPSTPVWLGTLPLTEGARPNLWRDMKVYKDHVFIVADGAGEHGMQVFDLTRLRDVPTTPAMFAADTTYHANASSHNIVINEDTGFAYLVGNSMGGETCGGALHMVDIRDPRHPKFAGCFADTTTGNNRRGGTHDSQCVTYRGPDRRYAGHEICFNASETALGIADVTNKASPRAIGRASHPNTAYTHQGWLSDDQRHFFVNDEGDEVGGLVSRTRTIVYDVTDLDDPVVLTEFLGTTSASDHNLYVRGRYMFQSNYVSGLRVIDIADPKNPVEVGYFDTVPQGENAPGFAGSWSNYPYFPSGTIVVTSMREGLFVLRHRPEAPLP